MVALHFTHLTCLRGSALEGCLKASAVAVDSNLEPVKPASIFAGIRDRHVDPETVDEVWQVALKVQEALRAQGFVVEFAQSNYHHKNRKSSSVGLAASYTDGREFLLEAKLADDNHLVKTLRAGGL